MVTTAARTQISEAIAREKDELLSASPQIDTERLKILLEVYEELKTKPNCIKRATVFYRLCNEKTIYIDNNPIVGAQTRFKYGAHPVPEEGCAWMLRAKEFALPRGKVTINPEVREWVDKAAGYWIN